MSDDYRPDGLDAVSIKAGEAAVALESLREPAERAASAIELSFGKAGESLARSLTRAAADGKISLAELAQAALSAVSSGLGRSGGAGLGDAIAQAVGSVFGQGSFAGARADGGGVLDGGAYLVGERGPEVFRPHGAGVVDAVGQGGGMTVNLKVEGGAQTLIKSEAQIASMLARAAALGARRL